MNMDKFTQDDLDRRTNQRATMHRMLPKQLHVGDSVKYNHRQWTIVDFIYKDQSVILRHGDQYCDLPVFMLNEPTMNAKQAWETLEAYERGDYVENCEINEAYRVIGML